MTRKKYIDSLSIGLRIFPDSMIEIDTYVGIPEVDLKCYEGIQLPIGLCYAVKWNKDMTDVILVMKEEAFKYNLSTSFDQSTLSLIETIEFDNFKKGMFKSGQELQKHDRDKHEIEGGISFWDENGKARYAGTSAKDLHKFKYSKPFDLSTEVYAGKYAVKYDEKNIVKFTGEGYFVIASGKNVSCYTTKRWSVESGKRIWEYEFINEVKDLFLSNEFVYIAFNEGEPVKIKLSNGKRYIKE